MILSFWLLSVTKDCLTGTAFQAKDKMNAETFNKMHERVQVLSRKSLARGHSILSKECLGISLETRFVDRIA